MIFGFPNLTTPCGAGSRRELQAALAAAASICVPRFSPRNLKESELSLWTLGLTTWFPARIAKGRRAGGLRFYSNIENLVLPTGLKRGQVRDNRLCQRPNFFKVSGVPPTPCGLRRAGRFQLSGSVNSWLLNRYWLEAEGQHREKTVHFMGYSDPMCRIFLLTPET